MKKILQVENLKTYFYTEKGIAKAVDSVSFDIHEGETLSLVGESGCGKTVTALSIMQLVSSPNFFFDGGRILLSGKDLLTCEQKELNQIRGNQMAMIFQEPMKNLNPVFTIGYQLMENLRIHKNLSQEEAKHKVWELLDMVYMPDKKRLFYDYPHQLSGGMRQRVMIAMAIACDPLLLIADEPTTALDVKTETEILDLIKEIQKERKMAMLLITHDLGMASDVSDRTSVMYAGKIVETASSKDLLDRGRSSSHQAFHPYSYKLLKSLPAKASRKHYLETIEGRVPLPDELTPGCRFFPRCHLRREDCDLIEPPLIPVNTDHKVACLLYEPQKKKTSQKNNKKPPKDKVDKVNKVDKVTRVTKAAKVKNVKPEVKPEKKKSSQNYLEISDLKVYFPIKKGVFQKTVGHTKAVDGVSLKIPRGSTFALVGTSGCGKTTLGRAILNLTPITSGKVKYKNFDIESNSLSSQDMRLFRQKNQIIFQDPFSSLNPKMLVKDIISESLRTQKRGLSSFEIKERVDHYISMVGLNPQMKYRYPHEFSGGQRQRIGIARSLISEPNFIVCDEVTSALDVSVQAQILNLLERLQRKLSLTYLFISHDKSVVKYMADHVAEMQAGRLV